MFFSVYNTFLKDIFFIIPQLILALLLVFCLLCIKRAYKLPVKSRFVVEDLQKMQKIFFLLYSINSMNGISHAVPPAQNDSCKSS